MPAKSKQQFKLMKGIATGSIPAGGKRPSKAVAQEFVKGQSPKGLPKKVSKRKKFEKKVAKKLKKVFK